MRCVCVCVTVSGRSIGIHHDKKAIAPILFRSNSVPFLPRPAGAVECISLLPSWSKGHSRYRTVSLGCECGTRRSSVTPPRPNLVWRQRAMSIGLIVTPDFVQATKVHRPRCPPPSSPDIPWWSSRRCTCPACRPWPQRRSMHGSSRPWSSTSCQEGGRELSARERRRPRPRGRAQALGRQPVQVRQR
jgi:hypothetical protein